MKERVEKKRIIRTCSVICLSFLLLTISFIYHPLTFHEAPVSEPVMKQTGSKILASRGSSITTSSDFKSIEREDIHIIPGGQSIGVQLETNGILVVGHHSIEGNEGVLSPGQDAEVLIGDLILGINRHPIKELNEIKKYVNEAGKKNEALNLKIKRGDETIETSLQPVLDKRDNEYKIGLYIRNSAAGIGTMTFHDPESKRYGALGHIISDMDTKKPVDMMDGTIVRSSVVHIDKGGQGTPGEKHARFSPDQHVLGNIVKNTSHGIFGVLDSPIENGKYDEPMPITRTDEVKEGPAKILTVVDKEKVEEFDIEIVNSVPQSKPDIKGMVIKITDPDLLERSGGIVQGMSGSPIIQNGKIVGAVTHVFVNDPTSGYGVHIEWMLKDAGIMVKDTIGAFDIAS